MAKLVQTQGTLFPNANWRSASSYIFQNLDCFTEFTQRTGASNWTTFNPDNLDHIQVKWVIRGITQIQLKVSHDSGGNGVFTEEQTLASSGTQGFTSSIIEQHYPLRPVISTTEGGYYTGQHISQRAFGIFDTTAMTHLLANPQTTDDAIDENPELQADPVDLKLSAMFKMGLIPADQIGTGAGQIPREDFAGDQGNVANLLGTSPFYIFPAGNTQNPIVSNHDPFLSIAEPTLLLELFDFNIRGYNGQTGDRAKVVAVIPKEELQTGARQGTLHYYPQFPVFIDLKIPEDKTYYDLNAVLRAPDGTIANDLLNPTEITLLIREGEEERQIRMARKQAELMAEVMANRNQAEITNIGVNNPRL